MKVIACVDNQGGMLFNNRRQSRDQMLCQYILDMTGGARLWMNKYSEKLFLGADNAKICVSEDFLDKAGSGEYCFVENKALAAYEEKTEEVVLCRWNRDYPGDFFLDIDLSGRELLLKDELKGSSHEKISIEIYGCRIKQL